MSMKTIPKSYKILQKGGPSISTFGGGSTTGKYVRMNSSISKLSMNRYRVTITMSTSSSGVYNGYGIKVYAHVGGSKVHLGTPTISGGSFSQSSFTHDFDISGNTSVYASCICAYCENGSHSEDYDKFTNQTSADTATYENPNSAPPAPTLTCGDTVMGDRYVGENSITLSLSAVSDPNGDPVSYRIYGWKSIGNGWESFYSGGDTLVSTDRVRTLDISGHQRGTRYKFHGRALDNKDAWSPVGNEIDNIYRNKIPNTPTISITNGTTILGGNHISEGGLTVSLSNVTDPEGGSVSYVIYAQYNDGSGWKNLTGDGVLSWSQSAWLDISNHGRGTQYKFWGYSYDNFGAWSNQSNTIENVYRNRIPWTPSISLTSGATNMSGNLISESGFTITLEGGTDPEGSGIGYHLYGQYQNPGGGWASLGDGNSYLGNVGSKHIDISGHTRGTRYKFWGHTSDNFGAWSSSSGEINNIYRNRQPNTPTLNITGATAVNGNWIAESSFNVELSTVTDPEGGSIGYHLYGQYAVPGGGWASLGDGNSYLGNVRTKNINISGHTRGTRYKFWGYSADNFNVWSSSSNIVENVYRNRVPNTVATINPGASVITGNTIDISWANPGDPDGQSVTFKVEISVDNGSYQVLNNSQSNTNYSYNISSHAKGTLYKFRVTPNDGMVAGSPKESPLYRKDFAPIYLLPNNNCTLHQTNPRLIYTKINRNDVFMCVNCNGTIYNSRDNGSMFTTNNTQHSGEICYVFRSINLRAGSNTISIYNSDGTLNSTSVNLTINIDIVNTNILGEIITKDAFDIIVNKSGDVLSAYNTAGSSYESITKDISVIKYDNIIKVIKLNHDSVRTTINNYDSNKISQVWNNIGKESVIRRVDIEQVINSLQNF